MNKRDSLVIGKREIKFASPIDSKFVCGLCGKLMTDPIQTQRGKMHFLI